VAHGTTKMQISLVTSVPTVTSDTVKVWINGQPAVVETVSPADTFKVDVKLPSQLTSGLYDLKVQVGSDPANSDLVPKAVQYTSSNNVDVSLVIDRSGSMADSDKMHAASIAAGQFVGQMHDGDRVGVVSFDDIVEEPFPLTIINPPSPISNVRYDVPLRQDRKRGISKVHGLLSCRYWWIRHSLPVFRLVPAPRRDPTESRPRGGQPEQVRAAPPPVGPARARLGLDRWGRLSMPVAGRP
jgi:von Willebrand factor type A domain